jgi:hypothetical protein
MLPSPTQLDAQSKIKIDKWVDIFSDECKNMDDNYEFTRKCLKLGMQEPAFLATDFHGRLWGKGTDGYFYPYHFEYGKKLIGYKISKKAAN